MVNINCDLKEKLKDFKYDNMHIVIDFDRTLSCPVYGTSWAILANSGIMPDSYVKRRDELFKKYYPIEIDETIDEDTKNIELTKWWKAHINLLCEYKVSKEVIDKVSTDHINKALRPGVIEFLKSMRDNNVPVIILSAGIGNFIEAVLNKYNCYYDNIHIISNMLKFENGVVCGMCDNIIHTLNKHEAVFDDVLKEKIDKRPNIILAGDKLEDIYMVDKNKREDAFKIGFLLDEEKDKLELYNKNFDIVLSDKDDYFDISSILKEYIK